VWQASAGHSSEAVVENAADSRRSMSDTARPPRDNLVRALPGNLELRAANGKPPTLFGHFGVFNEWAEIESAYEGHFMERVAPGAFAKTIRENRDRMKCLFHHGRDPQIGDKPLGTIASVGEDSVGAAYEVELFDTSYNRDLLPGLQAGVYGSSYRFRVVRDEFVVRPKRSAENPDGLPERTIVEAQVPEFGPTPWPAYLGATAGARSLTDELALQRLADQPERLEQILSATVTRERDPDTRLYERCAEIVGDTIWALHPPALATIMAIIGERHRGYKPTPEEIRERIGARDDTAAAQPASPVAVINLFGPIVPRAGLFDDISGAASVESFRAEFSEALASADIGAILINIDSPGGSAELIPELASDILAARGTKPIVAIANTLMASGAYWIACAADVIVVSPSGNVGSVGVYTAHEDWSKADEMMGVKTTLVSSKGAPYKVEGNPFEPLSEEARQELQRRVNAIEKMFVAAVAKGRGVTTSVVLADFGQGRLVMAQDAVTAGMADRVATFDQTLQQVAKDAQKVVAANRSALNAGPIQAHTTAVVDEPWDGPAEEAKLPSPITGAIAKGMYAWYDGAAADPDGDGWPDAKSAYKFPHHKVTSGKPGAANVNGVRAALSRLPQAKIPDADRAGVEAHLQRHLNDFKSTSSQASEPGPQTAAARSTQEPEPPEATTRPKPEPEPHAATTRQRREPVPLRGQRGRKENTTWHL
jgi:capsid assembly protease